MSEIGIKIEECDSMRDAVYKLNNHNEGQRAYIIALEGVIAANKDIFNDIVNLCMNHTSNYDLTENHKYVLEVQKLAREQYENLWMVFYK